jgi:hypothetical protein
MSQDGGGVEAGVVLKPGDVVRSGCHRVGWRERQGMPMEAQVDQQAFPVRPSAGEVSGEARPVASSPVDAVQEEQRGRAAFGRADARGGEQWRVNRRDAGSGHDLLLAVPVR